MRDEDRAVQERARRFVDEELIPREQEAEMHGGELPPDVVHRQKERLRELGLWSINMPRELGGAGLSMFQQVLVQEQIGRATNGLGWVVHAGPSWAVGVMNEDQVERFLRPLTTGERRECYAITEEGAGSDVDAIRTTARREGDVYVIDGEKWHVTSFNKADLVFVQARLTEGPHAGAHCLFAVEKGAPGLVEVRRPAYSHTYSDHHSILRFEGVRVPAADRIGEEGDGMAYAYAWFRYERLMIAARCCGAAERLIEEATAFAVDRVQFGRPIMEFQAVSHPLADSVVELWGARLMTYRTAQEIDEGADVKLQHAHCSAAKLAASEMANRVADRAVQVFGGRGYMRENVAERFYRELRVDRIWEGTSEIQRNILAGQLAKRGARWLAG
ncbi:MAG TPA: acyl-CoA dehydrogenase [Actinomycetota bacterium]|nr:acyl-CoA dehydrogenase [Actinomycetota bacterium]